jgi:hypothetical protein
MTSPSFRLHITYCIRLHEPHIALTHLAISTLRQRPCSAPCERWPVPRKQGVSVLLSRSSAGDEWADNITSRDRIRAGGPFSFLPRNLFDVFQPVTVGIVEPNAIIRRGIGCDQIRLSFDFETDNPNGARQTLYLPMMLPQPDASATTPRISRILLGNDILERRRAEVQIEYTNIFQRTQQYPPTPCGALTLHP